jgi:hypothetical protein
MGLAFECDELGAAALERRNAVNRVVEAVPVAETGSPSALRPGQVEDEALEFGHHLHSATTGVAGHDSFEDKIADLRNQTRRLVRWVRHIGRGHGATPAP